MALLTACSGQAVPAIPTTPAVTPALIACPVTLPNGSQPPGENVASPERHGNGVLWTVLPPDGKLSVERDEAGKLGVKFPWWRGEQGKLRIEGRRLDAAAEPLQADIPEGYGEVGFQATGLYFPTPGCWEVTGRVGEGELQFVVEVSEASSSLFQDVARVSSLR